MFMTFIYVLIHFKTSFKLHLKLNIFIIAAKLYKHYPCQNLQAIVNISKLRNRLKIRQQLPLESVIKPDIDLYLFYTIT